MPALDHRRTQSADPLDGAAHHRLFPQLPKAFIDQRLHKIYHRQSMNPSLADNIVGNGKRNLHVYVLPLSVSSAQVGPATVRHPKQASCQSGESRDLWVSAACKCFVLVGRGTNLAHGGQNSVVNSTPSIAIMT